MSCVGLRERKREWRIAYTAYFLHMLVVLLLQDKLDKVKVIISLGKREKCSLDEDNKVYGPREKNIYIVIIKDEREKKRFA